jgi:hypothetical protein
MCKIVIYKRDIEVLSYVRSFIVDKRGIAVRKIAINKTDIDVLSYVRGFIVGKRG